MCACVTSSSSWNFPWLNRVSANNKALMICNNTHTHTHIALSSMNVRTDWPRHTGHTLKGKTWLNKWRNIKKRNCKYKCCSTGDWSVTCLQIHGKDVSEYGQKLCMVDIITCWEIDILLTDRPTHSRWLCWPSTSAATGSIPVSILLRRYKVCFCHKSSGKNGKSMLLPQLVRSQTLLWIIEH